MPSSYENLPFSIRTNSGVVLFVRDFDIVIPKPDITIPPSIVEYDLAAYMRQVFGVPVKKIGSETSSHFLLNGSSRYLLKSVDDSVAGQVVEGLKMYLSSYGFEETADGISGFTARTQFGQEVCVNLIGNKTKDSQGIDLEIIVKLL